MLHDFITENREEIIEMTRTLVRGRAAPRATSEELATGLPIFMDQLIETLRLSLPTSKAMEETAAARGNALLLRGFTVAQVVHDYGDICQSITQLAIERKALISTEEFHTLNRSLDDAIAQAVTAYAAHRDLSLADVETEQQGTFAHELRNLLNVAMMSFEILKQGNVGIGGSTGAMLSRSLNGLRRLIDGSVTQVRLDSGIQARARVSMAELIEEIEIPATIDANARHMTLTVGPVERGVDVDVDRQLIGSALANLVQNALKFSHEKGHVSLTVRSTADRVLIDVEDECGGLPPGKSEELFRPFEQRSKNRKGLGLGLTISRRSVVASGGELHVHDLPGKGCIFTVDLPRLAAPS